ncbi:nucleotide exchange factor GrpE [Patescibacteria group bacterium]|nr:nucleotide exchange factor GrpE [Patescibacteria group bacterium]
MGEERKIKKKKTELEFIEEDGVIERDIERTFKRLKTELKESRKQASEYLSGWQRAKADAINLRREEEKNREMVVKFANERLLEELLQIADSLELALREPERKNTAGWKEGVERIRHQLLQTMRGYGVRVIEAVGLPFNPGEHESVLEEEVDEQEKDQSVLEELQKGYKIHDKVLRPTKVKIGVYKNN